MTRPASWSGASMISEAPSATPRIVNSPSLSVVAEAVWPSIVTVASAMPLPVAASTTRPCTSIGAVASGVSVG